MRTVLLALVLAVGYCVAQAPGTYCGNAPYSANIYSDNPTWVVWNTMGSTFDLSCFLATHNVTEGFPLKVSFGCSPSRTVSAPIPNFALLGSLVGTYYSGSTTFSCPFEGYFYTLLSTDNDLEQTIFYQASATVDGKRADMTRVARG